MKLIMDKREFDEALGKAKAEANKEAFRDGWRSAIEHYKGFIDFKAYQKRFQPEYDLKEHTGENNANT